MTYTNAISQIVKDLNSIYETTKSVQKLSFENWVVIVLERMIDNENKALLKNKDGSKGKIPDAIRQMLVLDDVTPNRLISDFKREVKIDNGSDGFNITKD